MWVSKIYRTWRIEMVKQPKSRKKLVILIVAAVVIALAVILFSVKKSAQRTAYTQDTAEKKDINVYHDVGV